MIARRAFNQLLLSACAGAVTPGLAFADQYPSRPVKIEVGFSPGGTIDVVARIIGAQLQTDLGQPFVVENRAGANGMLAAEMVAHSEPDGYMIFASNSSTITVNPTLFKNLKYNPDQDFEPLASVVYVPLVMAVNPDNADVANVKSVADLVAAAKAKPGQLTYGSAGNGNVTHLAFELLKQRANIDMVHVPYRGAAAAETAALAGEVSVIFDTLSLVPYVKAGKLRPLAIASGERLSTLPDVPTMAEVGYPDFEIGFWVAFFAQKKTPKAIVDLLQAKIVAAAKDPAVRAKLEQQGMILTLDSKALAERVRRETATLADVVHKANITAD